MKANILEEWLESILEPGEAPTSQIEVSIATKALGLAAGYSAQMILTQSRILIYGKSWIGAYSQIINRSTVTSVIANTQFIQGTLAKATLLTISHSGTESHFPTLDENCADFVQKANTAIDAANKNAGDNKRDFVSKLAQLSELFEKGHLTAEEFEQGKQRLMN